ncbi:MAG TPA: plastocyanin/azurin family copper-binding protein [Candidatus Acidoferrales bacterium]|nr:plastocyanin/azurin family copper-binding protein [Candidatus Acidoferrales bacterium]
MVSMTKAIGGIVVIVIIIVAIVTIYGNSGFSSGTPRSTSIATSTVPASSTVHANAAPSTTIPANSVPLNSTNDTMAEPAGGSVTINVALSNTNNQFVITPNVITVSPGESVTLNVTNDGTSMPHNLVIPALNASTPFAMSPGQNAVVKFTAPSGAGNYTYYCSIGSHRALGMVGTLVVKGG